jgi:hypothetical protein
LPLEVTAPQSALQSALVFDRTAGVITEGEADASAVIVNLRELEIDNELLRNRFGLVQGAKRALVTCKQAVSRSNSDQSAAMFEPRLGYRQGSLVGFDRTLAVADLAQQCAIPAGQRVVVLLPARDSNAPFQSGKRALELVERRQAFGRRAIRLWRVRIFGPIEVLGLPYAIPLDAATEAGDRAIDDFEEPLEQAMHVLRIQRTAQTGLARDIGEQDRHLPPFASG